MGHWDLASGEAIALSQRDGNNVSDGGTGDFDGDLDLIDQNEYHFVLDERPRGATDGPSLSADWASHMVKPTKYFDDSWGASHEEGMGGYYNPAPYIRWNPLPPPRPPVP